MNKFLIFSLIFMVLSLGVVSAAGGGGGGGGGGSISTSTFLTTSGDALAELSTEHDVSPEHSGHLWADLITEDTNEARVHIEFNEDFSLGDLGTLSWMHYVEKGYITHVDVLLDVNDNGVYDGTAGGDDALVFEYAKVNPNDCDDAPYPTGGPYNTFDDKGIVDDARLGLVNFRTSRTLWSRSYCIFLALIR